MCDYFSCIITRDLNVHWLKQNPQDHQAIVDSTKLDEKKLENRDFVRIEITPKDPAHITRNQDDWTLRIDEERTLPDWYEKNVAKATKACWKAWTESVKINIALNDESVNNLTDTFIKLYGSSSAELYGYSSAVLHGSSSAELHDSSRAELYGSSRAVLHGSSRAELHDSSSAELHGSSRAVLKSKLATAIEDDTIYVYPDAKILKQAQV